MDVNLFREEEVWAQRSIRYNVSHIPNKRVPLFDDGGYDLTLVKREKANRNDLIQYFDSHSTVDIGHNWYNYINTTLDILLHEYSYETNITRRNSLAQKIQLILYEDLPSIPYRSR